MGNKTFTGGGRPVVCDYPVTDEQHSEAGRDSGTACEQKYEHINNSGHVLKHTCSIRRQTPAENTISVQLGVCINTLGVDLLSRSGGGTIYRNIYLPYLPSKPGKEEGETGKTNDP